MAITVANVELTNSFDYWRNRTNELAWGMTNFVVSTESNTAQGNASISDTFTCNNLVVGNSTVNVSISPTSLTIANLVANDGTFFNSLTVGNSTINTYITPAVITINNTVINSTSASVNGNITVGNSTVNTYITPTYINVGSSSITNQSIILANSTSNVTISIPTTIQTSSNTYFLNANGQWAPIQAVYNPVSNNQVTTTGTGLQQIDSFATATFQGAEYTISVKDNVSNNYYFTKILTSHDGGVSYFTDYGGLTSNNTVGTFSSSISGPLNILYFTPVSTSTTVKFVRIII